MTNTNKKTGEGEKCNHYFEFGIKIVKIVPEHPIYHQVYRPMKFLLCRECGEEKDNL